MSAAHTILPRAEMALPELEGAYLREAYQKAGNILEYGAGGSTVMASQMAGKNIVSIETDQDWVTELLFWFAENPGKSPVDIVWANIGPTGPWGRPKDETHWRDYSKYPLEIWNLEDLSHPDIVLVDGRFRAGCVLATAFRCSQTTRVLVDDYARRETYHAVEEFVGTPKLIGRMAEFTLTPTPIPADRLLTIISLMQDPY